MKLHNYINILHCIHTSVGYIVHASVGYIGGFLVYITHIVLVISVSHTHYFLISFTCKALDVPLLY